MADTAHSARSIPAVWGQVPQRNRHFTGRSELLDQLGRQLGQQDVAAVLPHALQGLGGVGKTQLAIEYAYRASDKYDVVWWISADQPNLIPSQLATLAPRLGLTGLAGRLEDAVDAVLDALRRGDPFSRWLLVFDNADQPEQIREYFPVGELDGHVLVTSRNHRWHGAADTVEVDVFSRAESQEFLTRRVQGIEPKDADLLAEQLGDLPLALEQAGALQAETGMSVKDYLDLLAKASYTLLAENPPSDYPVPVAAAWSLSMNQLSSQMPFALEFLRRCAFFGPEPIPRDLFVGGANVLPGPMREQLGNPILVSRAMRELGRYALARIDNNRRTIQVHRLIQKLVRDALTADDADNLKREVHDLLVAADPRDPDDIVNWPRYEALLPHLEPSAIVESTDQGPRRLIWNVAQYLYAVGDYRTSNALIDQAIERWTSDSGGDDQNVLLLASPRANVLFALGEYGAAYDVRRPGFERMREVLGENHEITLVMMSGYAADLRSRGDFAEALRLDEDAFGRYEQVYGFASSTFNARNNLAVDHEFNGRYATALELQEQNHRDRIDLYGRDDEYPVVSTLAAISRVLRHQGRYKESLVQAQRANILYAETVRRQVLPEDHPWILVHARDLSIVQRLAGDVETALHGAEATYDRYLKSRLGTGHPDTLAAGINRGNALRLAGSLQIAGGDIDRGIEGLEQTIRSYGEVWTPDHPFFHIGNINLAVARLVQEKYDVALSLLKAAYEGLQATVGPEHHYTLVGATNLATAHAELGDVAAARQLGLETLPRLHALLGDAHPHTLGCALNLRLDQQFLAEPDAEALRATELRRFETLLGKEHYDVVTARAGGRISSIVEPPSV